VPGHPLVLPNAWDAASATMVIDAGFPAIATSSAATASVLGYADSEATPVEEVLAAAARIVRAVSVPVTVDFERGYRLPAAELAERLTSTGAVGLNLEDSDPATGEMIDPAEQADFLASVREAATSIRPARRTATRRTRRARRRPRELRAEPAAAAVRQVRHCLVRGARVGREPFPGVTSRPAGPAPASSRTWKA
jgi:2-methylisocitrate lyase-like PEP mutase family enzyme